MKKIIALLLVIAMVGTMLIACGNGDKETTTADNGSTTTTILNADGTTTTVADETTTSTEENDETTTSSDVVDETTTTTEEETTTTTTESTDPADLPEGTKMLEKKTYSYTYFKNMNSHTGTAENVLVDENLLVYTLDKSTKTAGVGDPYHKTTLAGKDLVLPEYCYYEGVLYTVTNVTGFYLYGPELSFKSITLSKHMTTLGVGSFNNVKFTEFNWGESKIEFIDQGALCAFPLETITIPATVKVINGQAFRTAKLKSITFEGTDIEFRAGNGEGIFAETLLESIVIPEGTKEISRKMFYHCVNLASITFPSSLETISVSAFENSPLIREFNYSGENNVKTIGANAFLNCEALQVFPFSASLTTIDASAFRGTNLMKAEFPATLAKLGESAILSNNLKEITVAEGNTNYSSENGVLYNGNKTTLILYPSAKSDKEFTLPASVTTIEYHAIFKCTKLEKLNLNASLTRIGINADAFPGCNKLQSITVADGNTKYKAVDGVLYSADGKTLIQYPIGLATDAFTVPAGVTKIGGGAFAYGTKVKAVNISANANVVVDPEAFTECTAKINYVD